MKALITKTKNGQFHFSLTGGNGRKIAQSETYTSMGSLLKTLKKYFPEFKIKK